MRIVYVGKHDQANSNDDEGAITHALQALGHDVQRVRESNGGKAYTVEGDFLLFHKWDDMMGLNRVRIPKVFWYFDLVNYPDPTIEGRNRTRRDWMARIVPRVELGFCTDGDWAAADGSGKLVWLTQGADERVMGYGATKVHGPDHVSGGDGAEDEGAALLFTGTRRGGVGRMSWVDEMAVTYGRGFLHVPSGIHGREMADLIATCSMVLAPDSPVTDYYWSNRVYNVLGFGGFLLHPYAKALGAQYRNGRDLVFYQTRSELHELIRTYVKDPDGRRRISNSGLHWTRQHHTYRNRCATLIETVRNRLGIK